MKYNNKKNHLRLKFHNDRKCFKKIFKNKEEFPIIKKIINDGIKILFSLKEAEVKQKTSNNKKSKKGRKK